MRTAFITIVGRASRFAKIGGEQVPFVAIEEALATLTGGQRRWRAAGGGHRRPRRGASGERLARRSIPSWSSSPAELVKRARGGQSSPGLLLTYPYTGRFVHQIDAVSPVGIQARWILEAMD